MGGIHILPGAAIKTLSEPMIPTLFESAGCLTGLAGAALLAANIRVSNLGWWLFLASNAFMIAFSIQGGHHWLLLQQCGFTLTSVVGVWRSTRHVDMDSEKNKVSRH